MSLCVVFAVGFDHGDVFYRLGLFVKHGDHHNRRIGFDVAIVAIESCRGEIGAEEVDGEETKHEVAQKLQSTPPGIGRRSDCGSSIWRRL